MSQTVVVAKIVIAEGRMDEAIAVLTAAIEGAHTEAGCLAYALHKDTQDPNTLVIVERYTSHVAFEAHMQTPYLKTLMGAMPALLGAPPEIRVLEPIPVGDPMKGTL